jgi:hypothetical protein
MAQPLLIAHPENASIEELKQVSRVGYNETATRCSAIQMLLAGTDRDLVCSALLVTDVFAALFARSQRHRAHLADDESTLVQ